MFPQPVTDSWPSLRLARMFTRISVAGINLLRKVFYIGCRSWSSGSWSSLTSTVSLPTSHEVAYCSRRHMESCGYITNRSSRFNIAHSSISILVRQFSNVADQGSNISMAIILTFQCPLPVKQLTVRALGLQKYS